MSPGHSEIMSPGVPTSCRLVERRPAGGWFLPSSGVLVNPLRLISVGFAAGRWNPAIAIAYGAPRAIWESAADMAATVHYAVDRSGFRRHTRSSPTRAAPHSSLEVSVPVPAPNRRALQRGCHLCSDTALSGWDRQFESAFLQRRVSNELRGEAAHRMEKPDPSGPRSIQRHRLARNPGGRSARAALFARKARLVWRWRRFSAIERVASLTDRRKGSRR
jgi:hypothetical protein